jgi:Glutamate-cysteine ligase family 2(GCS2)
MSRDETGRQAVQTEHRFGASPALTVGVEEELLLVDGEQRLVPAAERVIEGVDAATRESVSTEIFAAQIELKTGICGDAMAAATELRALRAAVRATGIGLLGAGIHPDDGGEAPWPRSSGSSPRATAPSASAAPSPPAASPPSSPISPPRPSPTDLGRGG